MKSIQIMYKKVTGTELADIFEYIVRFFPRIERLNLSNNKLEFLPSNFELSRLKFYGSNNMFEEVPPSFFELDNLSIINLKKNQIRKIPEQLFNLLNLRILNIKYNFLVSFPETSENFQARIVRNRVKIYR